MRSVILRALLIAGFVAGPATLHAQLGIEIGATAPDVMVETLDAATRRALLAVREPEPFEVHALQVYLTREPQPARHLFSAPLS